jgi:predicted RecA/RadA family phage recombinase
MKNMVHENGDYLPFTAAATVASGELVVVGALIGVSQDALTTGQDGILSLKGVYRLPKATGGGTAAVKGALVYRVNATGLVSGASASATLCGHAFNAAADGDAFMDVKLLG